MIATFLRSSSLTQWKMCEWSYTLQYVWGLRSPPNVKADIGNAAHKALELLARERLAALRGESSFVEPESGKEFAVGGFSVDEAVDHGWGIYKKPHYTKAHEKDCRDLVFKTLVWNDGECHPHNLRVVEPERFFDLELPYGWAAYRYDDPFTGKELKGQLRVRGTVDLLYRDDNGLLVYLDWKSGAKRCWAKGVDKTFPMLMEDDQLRLYYYALRREFPDDDILMAIHYMRVDGTTWLPYGDEQLEGARNMLRTAFEEIRDCEEPTRRMDECGPRGQPCSFCFFQREKRPDGTSLCDYYWGEYQQLGLRGAMLKHGSPGGYDAYGGGGGKSDRSE